MGIRDRAGYQEAPVRFGRHGNLVGTVCGSVGDEDLETPFFMFLSSGIIHRTGPNRLYVMLARALASAGFSSLRFDLSGIGDSLIPVDARTTSIQEQVRNDIDDALTFARQRYGATRFVVLGLCSGADNALRSIEREGSIIGAVLLDLNAQRTPLYYVHHYMRRVVSPRAWLNLLTGRNPQVRSLVVRLRSMGRRRADEALTGPTVIAFDSWLPKEEMRRCLETVVARDTKLLCVFTAGLDAQYNYRNQFFHLFPGLDFRDCLRFDYYADSDHTFSRAEVRDRLVGQVVDWATSVDFPQSSLETAGGTLASGATTSE